MERRRCRRRLVCINSDMYLFCITCLSLAFCSFPGNWIYRLVSFHLFHFHGSLTTKYKYRATTTSLIPFQMKPKRLYFNDAKQLFCIRLSHAFFSPQNGKLSPKQMLEITITHVYFHSLITLLGNTFITYSIRHTHTFD